MAYGVGIRRKDKLLGCLLNYLNEISLLRGLRIEVLAFWRESLCCISASTCGVCAPFKVRTGDPGFIAKTWSNPRVER